MTSPGELPIELRGVSEAITEGGGSWRSCSGCHELNEGHPTGPYSPVFRCALGNGCDECGGIGAIWDTTDYGAMAAAWDEPIDQAPAVEWPKARDVGRIGDMSPSDSLRVGLDSDNDVYMAVCGANGVGSVEFCTPGSGGGKSSRTRLALIALMVAMEADNAETPSFDWWARRNTPAKEGPAT